MDIKSFFEILREFRDDDEMKPYESVVKEFIMNWDFKLELPDGLFGFMFIEINEFIKGIKECRSFKAI